jgi:hypothetical protein
MLQTFVRIGRSLRAAVASLIRATPPAALTAAPPLLEISLVIAIALFAMARMSASHPHQQEWPSFSAYVTW